ncbi:MAG: hypothetical protein NTY77_10635 [Elusimicrobia bacterium]|nr:hypothetical protein [Elusimicrobiota bacterium]
MRTLALALLAAALCSCSTAGPYVTNISSNGAGMLTIEKCMAHLNAFTGVINNSDCTSTQIQVAK